MKATLTLLTLLAVVAAWGPQRAQAQCRGNYVPVYHSCCHHRDSCAAATPFVPSRLGGYCGVLGATDRQGTPYVGGDLEAYYWLQPRWSSGLRGTITGKMPAAGAALEAYAGAAQPRLMLYSITWSNSLLLADAPRWRLAMQAGAGLGGVNLYDKARQVQVTGRNCGRTTAEKIAGATTPVVEVGLAATYKLRGNDAPWLTLRGGYRQWSGPVPFGAPSQFSAYTVSLGITVPDAPAKRK